MNRRKFVTTAIGAGAALSLPRVAHAQSITARQVHGQSDVSHLHIYLSKIWDTVREETNGRLDVTVYHRNSGLDLGPNNILETLQSGGLEFYALNGNIIAGAHPVADIQGIPFAFSSADQATRLWDGELGAYLAEELAPTGIRLIPYGGIENGVKQIVTIDKPITRASDLEGFRMRVPNGALFVDFYESLGAEPAVVNFANLRDALAEHSVDGLENPLIVVEENQLFDTCNYVSLSNHQWAGFNMIASEDFWQSLDDDLREAVIRNARRFVPEQRAFVRAANVRLEQDLRARGMMFNTPDLESFRARLRDTNFYARWRESVGTRAWSLMEDAVGPVG
jgi:TRAP-type C4-dicarboxylate transport system substrate-binding protein